ncbi:MAG: hypothetical protein IT210_13700 [Armatimonadetes bacterium]|nr:hypothetical protein [Armatimonadota bacterium]
MIEKAVLAIALLALGEAPSAAGEFTDHGPVVPLASLRGAIALQNAKGESLVIACSMDTSPQGWILVTDLNTGASRQIRVPKPYLNSPPYGSIAGRNGKFYTCYGSTFLEFDPDSGEFTFHRQTGDGCYLGTAEGPDGTIYFGGCPGCHLIAFNPTTRELTDYGPMDPKEAYLNEIATDSSGWVYCGIGTARENLVAFHPATKARRQLIREEDRQIGTASAVSGMDGKVYAVVHGQNYRLFEGKAAPIEAGKVPPRAPARNITWGQTLSLLTDGRTIREYNMLEKFLVVSGPAGQERRIDFDYESGGSLMTLITRGPGGRVYGGSSFPACMTVYDPKEGGPARRLGNAYWHSFAVSGTKIAAGRYAGGYLDLYDTARPWAIDPGPKPDPLDTQANPRCLAQYHPDINVPIATRFHPDGRHIVTAGYPGYGYRGGGIAIYDLDTGRSELLPHRKLVPDHSIASLCILPGGDLLAGTARQGGHGTQAAPGDARLLCLDWKTKTVRYRQTPIRGAGAITGLEPGTDGLIYGLADGPALFTFDPATRRVRRQSLARYGGTVRHALAQGEDGSMYVLLNRAILWIGPGGKPIEKLADAPVSITNGIAITGGRIYFIAISRLWSYGPLYTLPK